MNLSASAVIQRVKNAPNKNLIQEGARYQSRLRVYTEPLQPKQVELETAWLEYKAHLSASYGDEKKYRRLLSFTTFPLCVVNLMREVVGGLTKVFDARNATFGFSMANERVQEQFKQVLSASKYYNTIEQAGRRALTNEPNIIQVIDFDDNSVPYVVLVCERKIKGIEFNAMGDISCVIFLHSKGKDERGGYECLAHYCEEYYRVVKIYEDGTEYLDKEVAHGIGYCPAKFIVGEALTSKDKFNRFSFLAPVLGVAQEFQEFETAHSFADRYQTWNVVQKPYSECGVEGCEGGIVHSPAVYDGEQLIEKATQHACPSCSNKSLIGPGTVVSVELDEDGKADSRDVFKFIAPSTTGLDYISTRQQGRIDYIKVNTVGYSANMLANAVNELQIRASMEAKRKPLLRIRTWLNDAYNWGVETMAKALYADPKIKSSADFGTEFYILSEQEVITLFDTAKQAGMPEGLVKDLYLLLIETKYRTNPEKAYKQKLLLDLNPYPFDSLVQLKDKQALGMTNELDLLIKGNFDALVAKFEVENGDILEYEKDRLYAEKIELIKQQFINYLDYGTTSEPLQGSEQGTTGQVEA